MAIHLLFVGNVALLGHSPLKQARAQQAKKREQAKLHIQQAGWSPTSNKELDSFYYAEDYHQQYLAKNPGGYCGLAGTGCVLNADSE